MTLVAKTELKCSQTKKDSKPNLVSTINFQHKLSYTGTKLNNLLHIKSIF